MGMKAIVHYTDVAKNLFIDLEIWAGIYRAGNMNSLQD